MVSAHIPGFIAAERAYENKEPGWGVEGCPTADCGECDPCLAEQAEDEAERYAEDQRKERRWER